MFAPPGASRVTLRGGSFSPTCWACRCRVPSPSLALHSEWLCKLRSLFFQQSGKNITYAKITSYAAHPEQASLCAPDLARHEFYRELMERQERLAESLQEDTFQEDSPWLTTRDPHQLENSGGRHHHGMALIWA